MSGGDTPVRLPDGVRPLTLEDPAMVGRYRLLGRIGIGGMGVVYLGRSSDSDPVAIKTLHPLYTDVADQRRRFVEEARLARRVTAGTAQVIEDASGGPRPYIVTEFIQGPPLSRVVERDGPLPEARLREVAAGIATALVAIHGAGLVHRDLKPENVLLGPGGPRVIDFGIAHEVDAARAHTQAGIVMGSPGWIAPERLLGHAAVAASDVFSWGCLVAFAASGRHPYGGGSGAEVGDRIVNGTPDLGALTGPLRELVAAALARDPAGRPAAIEIVGALRAGRHDELASRHDALPRPASAGAAFRGGPGRTATAGRDAMRAGPPARVAEPIADRARSWAAAARARVGVPVAWTALGAVMAAAVYAVVGGIESGTGHRPADGAPPPTLGTERQQPSRVLRSRPRPGSATGGPAGAVPRGPVLSAPDAVPLARGGPRRPGGGSSSASSPSVIGRSLGGTGTPGISVSPTSEPTLPVPLKTLRR
ncbi:serine/threonine-protein kinase [Actinomadura alba]|uniref:Serine/threonine protein kinase n=1 Tax=Actinomadura alba TaxID=406431 RepID=A0ABR7LQU8_9ACTN|nr:serine/threonine-protein kinase [Actinomadura alba]MBC6467130.1 serine/threonine protein kinase [Actinomadura alba]